ncbi:MAG TPA: thiamine pyrophosphate-binding protein, partial [Gemmataceae bacterium]|nr:thiamine pyrophosphate-binding protein [Gemmataceae bacterium]
MAVVDGGTLIGRVLQEQRVKYLFTINGGHIFPILANLNNHGIKMIHMRHEQATAYAADAWARSTATPGVCCVTAGCGLTNAVTGLCVAGLTNSAVVCLSGQHPTLEDGIGSFQEAYGSEICGSFAKYTKRVLDWQRISVDLRQAFREALNPPQGVALVEIPANIMYHQAEETTQFPGAKVYDPDELRSQGDPRSVERAVELLAHAEKPLLVGGDGVFWARAAQELAVLAELTHTPVYCRRAGQGALSEEHRLAVRGAWKKPFTGAADLVLAAGFRYWSGEKFGQPPTWNAKAKYVQIDPTPARIGGHVPAEVAIVGDPKLVLRQMIILVKNHSADFARKENSPWVREVHKVQQAFLQSIHEREQKVRDSVPIHPDRLARDLAGMLDANATVVIDSFTLSG